MCRVRHLWKCEIGKPINVRMKLRRYEGGKQEKLFHEIILQIGNRDDTHACSEEGKLAEQILTDYVRIPRTKSLSSCIQRSATYGRRNTTSAY